MDAPSRHSPERPFSVDSPLAVADVEARLMAVLQGGLLVRWPGPRRRIAGIDIDRAEFHIRWHPALDGVRAIVSEYRGEDTLNHQPNLLNRAFATRDDHRTDHVFDVEVTALDERGSRLSATYRPAPLQRGSAATRRKAGLAVVLGVVALLVVAHLASKYFLLRSLPFWAVFFPLAAAVWAAVWINTPPAETDRLAMYRVLQLVADPSVVSLEQIPVDQTVPIWPDGHHGAASRRRQ